jgi:hypothetical protein
MILFWLNMSEIKYVNSRSRKFRTRLLTYARIVQLAATGSDTTRAFASNSVSLEICYRVAPKNKVDSTLSRGQRTALKL